MLRAILGAALGLLLGAGMGVGLAAVVHLGEQPAAWTSYPTLAPASGEWAYRNLLSYLFPGILFGGGFGAIVGTIVGATGAVLRTLKAMTPQEPPRPAGP
jgi:hypothetical protein